MNQHAGEEWERRVTATIATQIRRIRGKMSAQRIADRTAHLGYPVARNTIANLESGRKQTIGIGEWLAIAWAIGVPPGLLLYPVGTEAEVEVVPGVYATPWDALGWLTGQRPPDGIDVKDFAGDTPQAEIDEWRARWRENSLPVILYGIHASRVAAFISALREADMARMRVAETDDVGVREALTFTVKSLDGVVREKRASLRAVRHTMRDHGLIVPALSPAFFPGIDDDDIPGVDDEG